MDNLVGALAIATLGGVMLIVGFVYLRSLRSGRNMDAAKNLAEGGSTPEHLEGAAETR